jgi:hypothetical protein
MTEEFTAHNCYDSKVLGCKQYWLDGTQKLVPVRTYPLTNKKDKK